MFIFQTIDIKEKEKNTEKDQHFWACGQKRHRNDTSCSSHLTLAPVSKAKNILVLAPPGCRSKDISKFILYQLLTAASSLWLLCLLKGNVFKGRLRYQNMNMWSSIASPYGSNIEHITYTTIFPPMFPVSAFCRDKIILQMTMGDEKYCHGHIGKYSLP